MASKLALVTGSTGGIGEAIALMLSSRGHDIIVTGFGSEEQIQSTLTSCRDRGAGRVEYVSADLSDHAQVETMFGNIKENFGRSPNILVNSAGTLNLQKGSGS